ncbi:MAG: PilZ domain-containing protein, partial [Bdellovibrionales bacterium]|nr:PilZ domain-containing protein [Oligoflexia bacterium]
VVADAPKPTAPKLQDLAPAARVAAPAASAVSAAMAAEVTAARILIQKAIPIEPEFEEHFDDEEVEAMVPAQAKAKTPMPPPLKTQTKTQYKPPARTEERRAQKRFNVDLRIILISKGRSFRSISQDVSLGGMKLKNKVPQEFSGEECMAYISTADARENIEMVCKVIPDPSDPRRVQFLEADSQQLKRLSKWLVENDSVKKAG